MSGYCAMGNVALATRPAITMTIAMTPASTGRSMKNFENMSVARRGGRILCVRGQSLGNDRDARIQLHQVVEDDGVAIFQALADDPLLPDPVADFDRTLCSLAVRADSPDEAALISLQHSRLRNGDHLLSAGVQAHRRKLTRQDLQLRIRKLGAQLHRAERLVDGRAGEVQAAAFTVRLAICQHQLYDALFIAHAAQAVVLGFRQREANPHWMCLRDGREQTAVRVRRYQTSFGMQCASGDARDWCDYGCVREIQLGFANGGSSRRERSGR